MGGQSAFQITRLLINQLNKRNQDKCCSCLESWQWNRTSFYFIVGDLVSARSLVLALTSSHLLFSAYLLGGKRTDSVPRCIRRGGDVGVGAGSKTFPGILGEKRRDQSS